MTVPTNIPETFLKHPLSTLSLNPPKDPSIKRSPFPQKFSNMFSRNMNIEDDEEVESFYQWMSFSSFCNFTDLCETYNHILHTMPDHHDYKLNGIRCSITICTMNKLQRVIKWMSTKSTDDDLKVHDDLLISLTKRTI